MADALGPVRDEDEALDALCRKMSHSYETLKVRRAGFLARPGTLCHPFACCFLVDTPFAPEYPGVNGKSRCLLFVHSEQGRRCQDPSQSAGRDHQGHPEP